ncbi:MAG: 1-deoxy-D-xylulose-5-phosphate synthase [Lachnospiraceae bacterium]|nr:1-deoxy-D-xylulose-5-phosphate synthase [Lachnospiraceae bacterium]
MSNLLDKINQPNDVKKIPDEQIPALCRELRRSILRTVSRNGGHLASNLGSVELTVALHRFLDLPKDKLVWDVGHQAYTHKLLTGRKDAFGTLRKKGGISGFPKRAESHCDVIDTGHSSTSISVAAGLAEARDLKGETHRIVAVIGDGSLSGGPAYEALNNVGRSKSNLIIVLNDNEMSISKNVGGMANYLRKVRMSENYIDLKGNLENVFNKTAFGERVANSIKKTKATLRSMVVPGEFFTEMGLTYYGPIDGHNIHELERALHAAEKVHGAVIIHAVTKKGKGYRPSETEPSRFHGTPPFDVMSGKPFEALRGVSYTDIFRSEICAIASENKDVAAITAAMADGTGLDRFQKQFPERFFDVGIAEGHAASFATGLSLNGMHPVLCVYSTFLQRAYDEIMQDICLNNRPVTLAIDRAGIVGSDGETHQGIFDVAFLSHMPGMTIFVPRNGAELRAMLRVAVSMETPTAVRYPRGSKDIDFMENTVPITVGKAEVMKRGSKVAILFLGTLASEAMELCGMLAERGIDATIINARFAAPYDKALIQSLSINHQLLVCMEEGVRSGSFSEHVMAYVMEEQLPMRVVSCTLGDRFLPQGTQAELRNDCGLTAGKIYERISAYLEK